MDDLMRAIKLLRKARPIIERSLGKAETRPAEELDADPAVLADIDEFLTKAEEHP